MVIKLFRNEFVLFFVLVLFMNFFGLTAIGNTLFLGLICTLLIISSSFKGKFTLHILFIVIGIICSAISSEIYRGQAFFETIRASAPTLCIVIYFFFRKVGFPSIMIEKTLYYLIVTFILCYFLQLLVYPKIIFEFARVVANEAGKRISLLGQGLATLGVLFGINKYLITKKTKYIILAIACLFINFNNGYRTMVFVSILFSVILTIRILGFSRKLFLYGILFVILGGILLVTPPVDGIIERMQARNAEQNFSNSDYLRTTNLVFHETQYFKSVEERIFGSGVPFKGSSYDRYIEDLETVGYWYQDWGLIGLSWLIGIVPIIAMIFMSIKSFSLKVNPQFLYAGTWMLSLLFSSITTHEYYTNGNFVIFPLLFVLIERENFFINNHIKY